ncbi:MAG TPA: hypothetical protein VGF97_02795 [Rhizomicrobium sp.]
MLGLEAQRVIWLRMIKLASGGSAAQIEAERMVSEKIVAAIDANRRLAAGQSPTAIIRKYRRQVRANARRLSK